MLLRKLALLHDQFHGLSLYENSDWRHKFMAAWQSGGAADATHVQILWISTWIPSEVTRTFFFDLPTWDSNSSSFSCRSFSSQREPTVVGSIKCRQWAPPVPVVRDEPPAGPGGGGKMCSGAWKHGPERPVGVISLCRFTTPARLSSLDTENLSHGSLLSFGRDVKSRSLLPGALC